MGGSTAHVSNVITNLKASTSSDDAKLLHWLMGSDPNNIKVKTRGQYFSKIGKCILLIPLWIILTPLFYAVHALINGLLNSRQIYRPFSLSIFENIDFPLAFAVLSGNEKMVKLFLEHGILIDSKDMQGYNVIHYLSDISGVQLEKATQCYSMLCTMVGTEYLNKQLLHKMVKYDENHHMQNAIEYASQFGNPTFAAYLMSDTMTKTLMRVNSEDLLLAEQKQDSSSTVSIHYENANKSNSFPKAKGGDWREVSMNITPYSAYHRHGFMSHILHLLIERSTTSISAESWYCLQNNKCIQKWMKLKFRQWLGVIAVNHVMEFCVTLILFVGMLQNSQGDMNLTPNKDIFTKAHVLVFLDRWRNSGPDSTYYYNLSTPFFTLYADLESEITGGKFMDYIELLTLIQAVPSYDSFSNMSGLYDYVCGTNNYTVVGDLVEIDNCSVLAADSVLNVCEEVDSRYRYYFRDETYDNNEFVVATSFLAPIYNETRSIFKNTMRITMTKNSAYGLLFFLAAYFSIYILLDFVCRITTLIKQISSNISMYSIFATPLQGSYLKGECNVFCSCAYLIVVFYYWSDISSFYGNPILGSEKNNLKSDILMYDRTKADTISTNLTMAVIMVFMLVARTILHLHNGKILPWIGTFVITTFQMAEDLFQFTMVYATIVYLFASIFHLFSRDAACPGVRDSQNYYIYDSYFSTFALTYGHIEMDLTADAVRLTYIIYVVMSIILLLNLIIAVMSSTASKVSVEPWASQLYQDSLLSEAIGMEHWCFTLLPFPSLVKASLKSAGFHVEETEDGKAVVSVEIFEEDPLKESICS